MILMKNMSLPRKPSVAITRDSSVDRLMERTLTLLDLKSRVKTSTKVLIKPNLVRAPPDAPVKITPTPKEPALYSPYGNRGIAWMRTVTPEGDITRRETLDALLANLKTIGAENITIAEASGGWDTELAYKSLGFDELAGKYGAKLVDLNWADATKIPVPNGRAIKEFWAPNPILEADLRINLTTLKVHGATAVTMCLKNWGIGIPPGKYYGFNKSANRILGLLGKGALPIHHHFDDEKVYGQGMSIAKVIADVCSAVPYELGIVDGLTTVHRAELSPKSEMKVERTNLMLASYDMVAVDSVATRVMGLDPRKIFHIYLAEEKGLGTLDLNKIEILGTQIGNVEMRCNPEYDQRGTMLI
jgi:uncharacterized protein (DUF362 family)